MKTLLVRLCALVILVLNVAAGELEKGLDRESVIRLLGDPKSRYQIGFEETLVYEGGGRVLLNKGKVFQFKNRDALEPLLKLRMQAAAGPQVSAPDQPAAYTGVPPATIVTDPNYFPEGTWGGNSDGRTLGIDGKRLSDHHLYSNDCSVFLSRLAQGLSASLPSAERSRVSELGYLFTGKSKEENEKRVRQFQARYGMAPERDKYYDYARWRADLTRANGRYQLAKSEVARSERLRVGDRIDLDQAPNDPGQALRERMKQAIAEMHRARSQLTLNYAAFYEGGRRIEEAKMAARRANLTPAITLRDEMPLFIYTTFERTPMLEGLAEAAAGRLHMAAKPIFLPAGLDVTLLESRQVNPAAKEGRASGPLDVSRIEVMSDQLKQHDGKALSMIRLKGWVLSRDVKPK